MLCKPCEQEALENTTVCPRSKSAVSKADPTEAKQQRRLPESKAETCPDALTYRFQPETEPPEQSFSPKQAPEPLLKPDTPSEPAAERHVYVPVGKEYVRTDKNPPTSMKETPPASGIIYEIAEELYRREKTASDLEALCQPPFKRVFTDDQLTRLDRQASERTRTLVAHAAAAQPFSGKPEENDRTGHDLSTSSAFWLQLMLMLPGVNLIAALVLSFRKRADPNKKAYSRAFLIWTSMFLSAALVFFAVTFFQDPANRSNLSEMFTALLG